MRILAAGREISAPFLVPKQRILAFLQSASQIQPVAVKRRFVQIEQSLNEESVIVREAIDLTFSLPVGTQQCIVALPVKLCLDKIGSPCRCLDVARVIEHSGSASEGRNH